MPPFLGSQAGALGIIAILIGILIGLLNCFLGYRIFRIILGIWGFVIGGLLCGGIAFRVLDGAVLPTIVIGFFGAVLGAVLAVLLYYVGIFMLGAGLGVIVGGIIGSVFNDTVALVLAIVLAIIGGIVAIILQKLMIILSTSFGGSAAVVSGIYYLIEGGNQILRTGRTTRLPPDIVTANLGLLIAWFVLGVAGVVVQYTVTAKDKPAPQPAPAPPPSPPPATG
jgi:hypothetical protein